jgi:SAM-dependent methyltransferase
MTTLGASNWLTRLAYRLADHIGILLGQRDRLTPPARIFADPDRVDGSQTVREFVRIGEATVQWLISQGLAPTHRVLEVGCGIGRMALPLTRHLRNGGTYTGIDITTEKVAYCTRTVTHVAPHFRFVHADIYSKYYNPSGKLRAAEYRFPCADQTYDFVFLISVFTHMLPEDLEHYLAEIARVLVPGGRCISSFWLTDTAMDAPYHRYSGGCDIANPAAPEHGVFYREAFVRSCYERYGLTLQTLRYGSWSGRKDGHPDSPQDMITAVKRPVPT